MGAGSTAEGRVSVPMSGMNTLEQICADKRGHIQRRKQAVSLAALDEAIRGRGPCRGFIRALRTSVTQGRPALIAEIKKASPSKGIIREDFDPVALAKAYEQGGATCLSVLTDTPYFQGEDAYLSAVADACPLPALRKDFMLDPYQVAEARALGADCILLIVAALSAPQLREMEETARHYGLDVLAEVHDEAELEIALDTLSTPLIGINNRNLKTLEVSLEISRRLSARIPHDRLAVCESGIGDHNDIVFMRQAGIDCFLVGESLMRRSDIATATRRLLGHV